jgi:hypothetical protein
VCSSDLETEAQSPQWVGKSSPRPKKARQESIKCEGVVDLFFFFDGKVGGHEAFEGGRAKEEA